MTGLEAGTLTRDLFSPPFFLMFLLLPLTFLPHHPTYFTPVHFILKNPSPLCHLSLFFLFSWPPLFLSSFSTFSTHFSSPSPFSTVCIAYNPPSHLLIPQLLVRGRLRWLTEAEMDEVSAYRRPNSILKEQHQQPTYCRSVTSKKIWWQLYTIVLLLETTEHCSCSLQAGTHSGVCPKNIFNSEIHLNQLLGSMLLLP